MAGSNGKTHHIEAKREAADIDIPELSILPSI